uniref:Uncharacterized protein n=1 Tax=Lepeophtheirus salmonis TaxID=72036 RepID=A0A0K2UHE3_LEPSM
MYPAPRYCKSISTLTRVPTSNTCNTCNTCNTRITLHSGKGNKLAQRSLETLFHILHIGTQHRRTQQHIPGNHILPAPLTHLQRAGHAPIRRKAATPIQPTRPRTAQQQVVRGVPHTTAREHHLQSRLNKQRKHINSSTGHAHHPLYLLRSQKGSRPHTSRLHILPNTSFTPLSQQPP